MLENQRSPIEQNGRHADPQVSARARRRTFSKAYKLKILGEVDACTKPGEIGLLLRREGLYSSQLHTWRKWRDQMQKTKIEKQKTARNLKNENARLQRENKRLHLKLQRAEALIDLQKKAARLLSLDESSETA